MTSNRDSTSSEEDRKESILPEIDLETIPEDEEHGIDTLYTNYEHLEVLEKAIADPEIEKIQATTFATTTVKDHRSRDTGFVPYLKWPVFLIGTFICSIEFFLYFLVRYLVKVSERLAEKNGSHRDLKMRLKNANSYQEWLAVAKELDEKLGYNDWKTEPANPYYDSDLIQKVINLLRELKLSKDYRGIIATLEVCVRANFVGVESWKLYSATHYGTKDLIEEYYNEVEDTLKLVRGLDESSGITLDEKARFFKFIYKNYGTTVLALSGGATMGWYHVGVLNALRLEDMIPRVVSGTSAGSIVGAMYCTRTEAEVKRIMVPEMARIIDAFGGEPITTWLPRMFKTGTRYAPSSWHKCLTWAARGSTTFAEAYARTGKVLNISVIPADPHSPPKILNHITSPDCVIWSAILASAAVPGLIPPVCLLKKLPSGEVLPWSLEGKHRDGSIRADIPIEALSLFNAKFTVVSQINPHIHMFVFSGAGSPGEPTYHKAGEHSWRGGFILSALERLLKLDVQKNVRLMSDLEVIPQFFSTNWAEMLIQRFDGNITIVPETKWSDLAKATQDPTVDDMAEMHSGGKRATWPKMHMIDNRLRIERQVNEGVEEIRAALYKIHQDPSSIPSADPPVFPGLPEEPKEAVQKRRQTLAKLGLPDDFTGSEAKFNQTPANPEEEKNDSVKKFVDNQERLVRRMSRGFLNPSQVPQM